MTCSQAGRSCPYYLIEATQAQDLQLGLVSPASDVIDLIPDHVDEEGARQVLRRTVTYIQTCFKTKPEATNPSLGYEGSLYYLMSQ